MKHVAGRCNKCDEQQVGMTHHLGLARAMMDKLASQGFQGMDGWQMSSHPADLSPRKRGSKSWSCQASVSHSPFLVQDPQDLNPDLPGCLLSFLMSAAGEGFRGS